MPNQTGKNELKVCDAVIRCLEQVTGKNRSKGFSPEDQQHSAPVEWVFALGEIQYVLEHTIVEPFEGHTKSGVDFVNFINPIVEKLTPNLPCPAIFTLTFDDKVTMPMSPKERIKLQNATITWFHHFATVLCGRLKQAQTDLENRQDEELFTIGSIEPAKVKLHLSISRDYSVPTESRGKLFPARFSPDDTEPLRQTRIARAMEKKLPKLMKWQAGAARTILILEYGDIALSNHIVILEAVERTLINITTKPNEIWLVSTAIDTAWFVHCLIKDGNSLPYDNFDPHFWRYHPEELNPMLA